MRNQSINRDNQNVQHNSANLNDRGLNKSHTYSPSNPREGWLDQFDQEYLKKIAHPYDRKPSRYHAPVVIRPSRIDYKHNHSDSKDDKKIKFFILLATTIAMKIFCRSNHDCIIMGALSVVTTYYFYRSCFNDKRLRKSLGDLVIEDSVNKPEVLNKIPSQALIDYVNNFITVPTTQKAKSNNTMLLLCFLSIVTTGATGIFYHKQHKPLIIAALSASSMYLFCESLNRSFSHDSRLHIALKQDVESFINNQDAELNERQRNDVAKYILKIIMRVMIDVKPRRIECITI